MALQIQINIKLIQNFYKVNEMLKINFQIESFKKNKVHKK